MRVGHIALLAASILIVDEVDAQIYSYGDPYGEIYSYGDPLPAGQSSPPPAGCGEKTPERAIRDGDLIAFDCAPRTACTAASLLLHSLSMLHSTPCTVPSLCFLVNAYAHARHTCCMLSAPFQTAFKCMLHKTIRAYEHAHHADCFPLRPYIYIFADDWWASQPCSSDEPSYSYSYDGGDYGGYGAGKPEPQLLYDTRLVLDRTKLNILVFEGSKGGDFGLLHKNKLFSDKIDRVAAIFDTLPTVGRCQSLCAWGPKFYEETGIHIKVHCWNFIGYEAKLIKARSECTCRPELAPYAGNSYVVGHEFMCVRDAEVGPIIAIGPSRESEALPHIHRAMALGLFGGMDVYDIPTNYAIPPKTARERLISNSDVFEDLNPYIGAGFTRSASIDPSSVDVQGDMLPILRDVYLTSGDALVGIPHSIYAVHLVHNPEHMQLGAISTWDEYIAELERLDGIDRDGDGVGDKPFCLPASALSWSLYLLETIAASFFQVLGPQNVRHFDTSGGSMASNLNTAAMREALRVFRRIWLLTDLTFSATAYERGVCVASLKPLAVVGSYSPNTVVGSTMVYAKGGRFVQCTPVLCPRAITSSSGQSINPAPLLVYGGVQTSIDKLSLLKDKAWEWISFLQHSEVSFSMLVQGKALPVLSSQFEAREWTRMAKVLSGIDVSTPMEAAASQSLLNPALVGPLLNWTGLEDHLGRAQAEVTNTRGTAVFLSSTSAFYQDTFEMAMQAAMQGITCRNSWDGFGICLEAEDEYNDGSPNLVTDEQSESFLQGGPAAYTDYGPKTLLWLTQKLEHEMNRNDDLAANGGNELTRAERLSEVRNIFKQPTLHLPIRGGHATTAMIPSSLRCHMDQQLCQAGYYKRSVCGVTCEPCPPGFRAEIETRFNSSGMMQTVWQCRICPFGEYQSAPGKLACVNCPNALFSTGRAGATSKEECTVPNYEVWLSLYHYMRIPLDYMHRSLRTLTFSPLPSLLSSPSPSLC